MQNPIRDIQTSPQRQKLFVDPLNHPNHHDFQFIIISSIILCSLIHSELHFRSFTRLMPPAFCLPLPESNMKVPLRRQINIFCTIKVFYSAINTIRINPFIPSVHCWQTKCNLVAVLYLPFRVALSPSPPRKKLKGSANNKRGESPLQKFASQQSALNLCSGCTRGAWWREEEEGNEPERCSCVHK